VAAQHDPVQHAWQVHQAVQNWTNQSEAKANILLPVESALFVFFGSRMLTGKIPEEVKIRHTWWLTIMAAVGLLLLFYGLGCLILVVLPRLRRKLSQTEAAQNAIYFGHLRQNEVEDIKDLLSGPTVMDQLAKQLKEASEITWKKHRWLQASMIVTAFGLSSVILSYFIASFLV
jgi:hypothetical protein